MLAHIKRIVNLTGHDVVVFQTSSGKADAHVEHTDSGDMEVLVSFPSEGAPRHLEIAQQPGVIQFGELEIPSGTESYTGELRNMPDPEPGTLFIVSRIVAAAVTTRDDLVFPAREVRRNGIVCGCRILAFPK